VSPFTTFVVDGKRHLLMHAPANPARVCALAHTALSKNPHRRQAPMPVFKDTRIAVACVA
jgi:hypothetical protein